MSELIIVAAAAGVPSIIFGVLFFVHMREEREGLREMANEAYWHIGAKGPKDVADAKAVSEYQQEALRQSRAQFERVEEELQEPTQRTKLVDGEGHEYEVVAGMD